MTNLEEVDPADEARTYRQQPFHSRLLVAVAGSAMHFLMAFVLLWALLAFVGLPDGNQVESQARPLTGPAMPGPAARATARRHPGVGRRPPVGGNADVLTAPSRAIPADRSPLVVDRGGDRRTYRHPGRRADRARGRGRRRRPGTAPVRGHRGDPRHRRRRPPARSMPWARPRSTWAASPGPSVVGRRAPLLASARSPAGSTR